ncbi:unnamed protein product [Urochloa decumbens]|uniref:GRF-type domain-containing protein n=1 Tax=Urochloa decumbens TaxID=240449 RepID=A0ABC9E8E8_9POAL
MARESQSSASNPQGAAIPLIQCTECGQAKILRRTSRREWSYGRVFYCCPFYKQDGTGCPFWFWEDAYLKKLEKIPGDGSGAGANPRMGMVAEASRMVMGPEETSELIKVGKEVVTWLKGLFFVCVCMLIVMVLDLLIHLIK